MSGFYVRESGVQFSVDYNREHYTDLDDNQLLLTKEVSYVNFEMLYDIEKIVRNEQNLTNEKLAEKVKKYLQSC